MVSDITDALITFQDNKFILGITKTFITCKTLYKTKNMELGKITYRFWNFIPRFLQAKHGCICKCGTYLQNTIEIV